MLFGLLFCDLMVTIYTKQSSKKIFIGEKVIISLTLATSRRSVSQGAVQKTAREKIKKAQREEAKIPGSGIPSDWSILTDFVNTRALLMQLRYTIWRRSETFQRVTRCSNLL